MDLAEYDDIIRRLTAMLTVQHEKNQAYDALFEAQRDVNARLTASMERLDASMDRLDVALARSLTDQGEINARLTAAIERLDTLLQRLVRGSGNGREA